MKPNKLAIMTGFMSKLPDPIVTLSPFKDRMTIIQGPSHKIASGRGHSPEYGSLGCYNGAEGPIEQSPSRPGSRPGSDRFRCGGRAGNFLALAVLLGILLAGGAVRAYVAIVNKTDHTQIHVVPSPGKVTIDGKLDDWDLSGALLMFMDASSKQIYSVRGAMMYDQDFLYVGAHVKDPTPMVNRHAFGGDWGAAWDADAIQIFLFSNPDLKSDASRQTGSRVSAEDQRHVQNFTLYYSTVDQKPGYVAMFTLRYIDKTLNPPGVEGAYAKDEDGKGYVLEYRIPWKALRTPRPIVAGDKMQIQWQLLWGNDMGSTVRCGMTDVRNPSSGDLSYMGPTSWGTAIFEKEGRLKLPERTTQGRAEGHIPIAFTIEKDSKVSLAICNAEGQLIRTGLGAQPYAAGKQTWLWDGLDDYDQPVPAGAYTVKLLTHDGIQQKLVCNIGVSGTPPYQTDDGTGGWAGDYRFPQSMGVDGDGVVLGTANAEAAPPTIRTDLDGRKKYGTAVPGHAVVLHKGFGYMLSPGAKITKFELGKGQISPFTTGQPETHATRKREGEDDKAWGGRSWQVVALTVVGDQLVVSSFAEDKLYLLDLASGEPRGEVSLKKPFGLTTAPDGTLYAVSDDAVGRYDLKTQTFTPLAEGLDEPKHLACDATGHVYVSLHGKTMQVWKLSPGPSAGTAGGKVLLKYGTSGGRPKLGTFDANGMLKPYGIGVDKRGRLWVAEADPQPKRYSVWNPDGTLWKDFFGSMDYSSTAYVDPVDPEYVYVLSVRYRVDYNKGTWAPDATILRERSEAGISFPEPEKHSGGIISKVGGRTFLIVGGGPSAKFTIYEEVKGQFVPRLADVGKGKKSQVWMDDNNDGKVQAESEIHDWNPYRIPYFGANADGKLNLYRLTGQGWAGQGGQKTTMPYGVQRINFIGFNEQGGLKYDWDNPVSLGHDPEGGAGAAVVPATDGGAYALISGGTLPRGARAQGSGHRLVKFSAEGKKIWAYHNVHCAFAWTSDAYTPGYLVGAINFSRGTTDELVAVTGYFGQYFLLDAKDGLFVDALGEDQRSAYKLDRDMVLTENFNGTLFRHPKNGKTYFLGGDADCRLWELTGLETVKRQMLTVTVTTEQFAKAGENAKLNVLAQQSALGKKVVRLAPLKGASADGNYGEWSQVQPLTICMEGSRTAQAQIGYDQSNLFVRFQIGDESPFLNTPTDQRLLFKTGDAVEVYLTTDLTKRGTRGQNQQQMQPGDVRITIARTPEGKLMATRYRYLTVGKEKPNAFSVETASSGKDTLDDVAPWNDLPMHATAEKDGYVVEVAIPWKDIGVTPKSGLALLGDVGVIYGNEGGTRNAIRYMWSDKSPEVSINNDIPSEIRIHPNQWGNWLLE